MNPLKRLPQFKFIGELPCGNWRFCLVAIRSQPDVVIICDMDGGHAPRMVYDGKLIELVA